MANIGFFFATGLFLVKIGSMEMSTDFQIPDFNRPLDSTERLSRLPQGRTVKRIVLRSLADSVNQRGLIALRNTWAYPDCYHVGIFEEALTQYNCQGQVKVAVRSMCDVDFEITWSDGV